MVLQIVGQILCGGITDCSPNTGNVVVLQIVSQIQEMWWYYRLYDNYRRCGGITDCRQYYTGGVVVLQIVGQLQEMCRYYRL